MIALMNGRNDDGFGKGLAKLTLGAGIGFALYMMFGGRGGLGFGRGSGGLGAGGEGPGTGAPGPALQPDAQPIVVRIRPDPADSAKTAIEFEGKLVSVAELIARVVDGGRRDVVAAVRGDTRQGGWDEIRQTLSSAGIQVIDPQAASSPTVSGGWYA